jgi:hypothetical protein
MTVSISEVPPPTAGPVPIPEPRPCGTKLEAATIDPDIARFPILEIEGPAPYAYPLPIPEPADVDLATILDPEITSWLISEHALPVSALTERAVPEPIPGPADELSATTVEFQI